MHREVSLAHRIHQRVDIARALADLPRHTLLPVRRRDLRPRRPLQVTRDRRQVIQAQVQRVEHLTGERVIRPDPRRQHHQRHEQPDEEQHDGELRRGRERDRLWLGNGKRADEPSVGVEEGRKCRSIGAIGERDVPLNA